MKIMVPSTKLKDIGRLDATLRLPMKGRIRVGMDSRCACCGEPIHDDFFIAGFKEGHKNILLHESCLPRDEPQPGDNTF